MDERLKQLKTDENGDIITYPVTGWHTVLAAGTALLVAFQYIEREEQFANGERAQVQLVMTPRQCLDLAGQLTNFANNLVGPAPPGTKFQ